MKFFIEKPSQILAGPNIYLPFDFHLLPGISKEVPGSVRGLANSGGVKVLMLAAHGGFGSERVPLGGGAAIFERLCQAWSARDDIELYTAGAGPRHPAGVDFASLAPPAMVPSQLGVLAYARFSRDFEAATTDYAKQLRPDIVLAHDVSEGPLVADLADLNIPVVTIFHVDVVDIFSRLYMGSLFQPENLTQTYRRTRSWPWPNVLKLVFEKQQQIMSRGRLNIVPSQGAASLLTRCYPQAPSPTKVIGWGAPAVEWTESEVRERAQMLRRLAGIPEDHQVLLTLSRLSPEKAQHRLLEAIALAEKEGKAPQAMTVVIAGGPAFMQGERHAQRLYRMAAKLDTKVIFTGHVGGLDKAGWYAAAQLFVVNSLHESYGLTTLEAMQQGCPVIAVESSGTRDTVNIKVGRLVPPGPELPRRLWGEMELLLGQAGGRERERLAQGAIEFARTQTFEEASKSVANALIDALS